MVPSDPLAARMRDMGLPTVFVNNHAYADDIVVPLILDDQFAAGALGAEHFAERGFHHLGYVRNSPDGHRRQIWEGFLARANQLGCAPHLLCLEEAGRVEGESTDDWRTGRAKWVRDWLLEMPKPLGILSYHDQFASSLCVSCENAGLSVPEEVAILGFGNNENVCELCPIPLSSIAMNDDSGTKAMHLLKRLSDGEPMPDSPIMVTPKGVIERHSTNTLSIGEPRVAQAIRYAWDFYDQPITTEDAAREVGITSRTLTRLFLTHLGRSFNDELRRKRLEHACDLLRSTGMTVEEISKAIGFRSPSHLYQTFQKKHSISPRDYRRKFRYDER